MVIDRSLWKYQQKGNKSKVTQTIRDLKFVVRALNLVYYWEVVACGCSVNSYS